MNGGYVMIDVKGLDLASTETQTRAGLYNEIKTASATDKTVVLVGAVNGDEDVSPVVVFVTQDGADYIVSASGLKITIESDDATTVETSGGGGVGIVAFDAGDVSAGQTSFGNGYDDRIVLVNAPSGAVTSSDIVKLTFKGEFIGSNTTRTFILYKSGDTTYAGIHVENFEDGAKTVIWDYDLNSIYYV